MEAPSGISSAPATFTSLTPNGAWARNQMAETVVKICNLLIGPAGKITLDLAGIMVNTSNPILPSEMTPANISLWKNNATRLMTTYQDAANVATAEMSPRDLTFLDRIMNAVIEQLNLGGHQPLYSGAFNTIGKLSGMQNARDIYFKAQCIGPVRELIATLDAKNASLVDDLI